MDEQEEIIRRLKKIAEDMQCVVFVLSQLKRSAERRLWHYPKMADFESHVALDKYADVIFLLYRPSYYDRKANSKYAQIFPARSENICGIFTSLDYEPEYAAFYDSGEIGKK